ncbi:MAG: TauD/TfdA family dioxygenase [Alphaproteobacteria bacterium]
MAQTQTGTSVRTAPSGAPGAFSIRRLSETGGAEITGIDLSRPMSPAVKDTIYAAFLEHYILVFPDQDLDPAAQEAFSRQFGDLEGNVRRLAPGVLAPLVNLVTNLDDNGNPTETPPTHGNYFWHTDKSYRPVPSLATILHAKLVPSAGGDTQFANTGLAYDALPEAMKQRIANLQVVHSWEASRKNTGNVPATAEEIADSPPVTHPLVRTHPDTGRKTLYLGTHTSHVEGMDYEEGRALLKDLLAHVEQPQFVFTHQWRPGDVVMWDNRTLVHRAVRNYDMKLEKRLLHRTVVKGTKPF